MIALRHTPAAPLAAYVDCLWYFEGAGAAVRERALPTGTVELVFNLAAEAQHVGCSDDAVDALPRQSPALVCGVFSRYFVIDAEPRVCVAGVHFRPGGAGPFLGGPASELSDRFVALEDLWGGAATTLRLRLLEAATPQRRLALLERALRARLRRLPERHPAVAYALRRFDASPQSIEVAKVAKHTGYSGRRLADLFRAEVGLTPKLYCRVQRFQAALQRIAQGRAVAWAEVAADAGYYDQAHFIRDFRAFSGLTPGAYVPSAPDRPSHAAM